MKTYSEIKGQGEAEGIKYPCLMKSTITGAIVFFQAYEKGQVLREGGDSIFGEIYDKWVMDNFKPFYGSVTITTEQ